VIRLVDAHALIEPWDRIPCDIPVVSRHGVSLHKDDPTFDRVPGP